MDPGFHRDSESGSCQFFHLGLDTCPSLPAKPIIGSEGMGFVPLNPSYVLRPIKTAAIVGAGTMCGGIAMSFAELGLRVSSSK
jgi:hypothetical protein